MRISLSIILVFCTSIGLLRAQGLPPVVAYPSETYQAGSQNWMLTQDDRGFLLAANNSGLLEYTGNQWTVYPSPNETILRSARVVGDRVYTGCYMEFGYWSREATGRLAYHSLSDSLTEEMRVDETFWNIIAFDNFLVFQSLQQLYFYDRDTGALTVFSPERGIKKVFRTGRALLFSDQEDRLYRLEGGQAHPISGISNLSAPIVHLWYEGERLQVLTATAGSFQLRDTGLVADERFAELSGKQIYSAIGLGDGGLAVGTISSGVFVFAADGALRYHFTFAEGLTNNTVLSLLEDREHNLWVGTDNGISCINLNAPVQHLKDLRGELGTVYAAAERAQWLYLGTNQGLYVQDLSGGGKPELVPGTKGQVWTLYAYGGELFCGHDSGTFLVREKGIEWVFRGSGTWKISPIPDHPDWLLQGNYYGLSVLERTGEGWQLRNKIDGFDYSARFFGLQPGPRVYVSHEYKGIFGLSIAEDWRVARTVDKYEQPQKGKHAGLIGYNGTILYFSREGIFRLPDAETGFQRDPVLNDILEDDAYTSGSMTVDERGRLWLFTEQQVTVVREGTLRDDYNLMSIPLSADMLNAMAGYENLMHLGGDTVLFGKVGGYLTLDLDELADYEHRIYLTEATARTVDQEVRPLSLNGEAELPYAYRNLRFAFAVPAYSKYIVPKFRYRLLGYYDEWSEWSADSRAVFSNIPHGTYRLEVQSKMGKAIVSLPEEYELRILRPWYGSYLALAIYGFIALALIYLVHRAYTRYYQKQQTRLEAVLKERQAARQREKELEIARLSNEQLQKEYQSKSRELATSTMDLVKKNELLFEIRERLLRKSDPLDNIKAVVKTIEHNTDEETNWEHFRQAFENADQDFFKKITQVHPDLTPNDLKLCAYLRLNLSSKEIAPLLNISTRSVEVKRYRLRKKMALDRDQGLAEYIMSF